MKNPQKAQQFQFCMQDATQAAQLTTEQVAKTYSKETLLEMT